MTRRARPKPWGLVPNLLLILLTTLRISGSQAKEKIGVFELRTTQLTMLSPWTTNEVRCQPDHCPVRVCLKHFQHVFLEAEECTFGNGTIDLAETVSGNTLSFDFFSQLSDDFTLALRFEAQPNVSIPFYNQPFSAALRPFGVWVPRKVVLPSKLNLQSMLLSVALEYRVRCAEHHFGPRCAVLCRPDPAGAFTCGSQGERVCASGRTGADCTRPATRRDARCTSTCKHGTCDSSGTCVCSSGYQGPDCDQCQKARGCRGTCSQPFECICPPGFGGRFCTRELTECARECQNGGTCVFDDRDSPACRCPLGFTGPACEHRIHSCRDAPCQNGGQCAMNQDALDFSCTCPPSFTGRFCQLKATSCRERPCQNGATCQDSIDGGFVCKCRGDWMGRNCDVPMSLCRADSCLNGGQCVDNFSTDLGFTCKCPTGFYGTRCEKSTLNAIQMCKNVICQNEGMCRVRQGQAVCECPLGFTGLRCETRLSSCQNRGCQNGGLCTDSGCLCAHGFFGPECESGPRDSYEFVATASQGSRKPLQDYLALGGCVLFFSTVIAVALKYCRLPWGRKDTALSTASTSTAQPGGLVLPKTHADSGLRSFSEQTKTVSFCSSLPAQLSQCPRQTESNPRISDPLAFGNEYQSPPTTRKPLPSIRPPRTPSGRKRPVSPDGAGSPDLYEFLH